MVDPKAEKDLGKKEVREVLRDEPKSRGRGRSEEEKRKSYAKYRKIKKKAIELEARNKEYLVLYPASDIDTNKKKFFNMGGNSAIIYVHEIAPRIKRKATLRHDMDSCNDNEKFHSGICSIADLDGLEKKLNGIGIKRVKSDSGLLFFKLPREYSKDEIKGMLKLEQKRLDNLNKLLYSEVLYPDVHRQILDLKKIIPVKIKNMNKVYRDVIGMEMIKSLMVLVKNYTQMTHGDLDEKIAAKEMVQACDIILAEISIFNELKLWDIEACSRVGSITVGLSQLLKGKILNKEDKKDEISK